ncbi:MAG: substrate-binding domain-containing protein [Anaerolineales bacterium]|nr:substrate-binding domain-containing protein [Anaerolineales bacterium]
MNRKIVRTIEDIARLAGVSKSTVSRALSDSPLIAEQTKERIRAIAKAHDFEISIPARRLSMRQSRTIAFVTHAYHKDFCVTDLFALEMLGAISGALAYHHYDLLMAHVDPYDSTWIRQYLATGRADGFILMTSTRKQYHIKGLVESKAPFIVWGMPLPNMNYCSVMGDNFTGGSLAARHLVSRGRRRIAFLGGPQQELEVQRRYDGFVAVLGESGLPATPELVAYADFTPDSGAAAMRQLLTQAPDLDAVFVNSDAMAVAALDVLRQAGRRVPEDVAVIGYDDVSIAALSQPALTTIRQNIPMAGRLLAENLIQYLQKGIVTNVSIPVELVIRQSA